MSEQTTFFRADARSTGNFYEPMTGQGDMFDPTLPDVPGTTGPA
jgi:hypothetical protein